MASSFQGWDMRQLPRRRVLAGTSWVEILLRRDRASYLDDEVGKEMPLLLPVPGACCQGEVDSRIPCHLVPAHAATAPCRACPLELELADAVVVAAAAAGWGWHPPGQYQQPPPRDRF